MTGAPYTVFGYKGKQVRDNIHSADLISAFDQFFQRPALRRSLQHRRRAASATARCWKRSRSAKRSPARELNWTYSEENRTRRSHLVDQRRQQVSAALPGMAAAIRRARHSARDLRRRTARAGRRSRSNDRSRQTQCAGRGHQRRRL